MPLFLNYSSKNFLYLSALILSISLSALYVLPLTPIDETRYASVAWQMWKSGDYLVPHLNNLPYSHKPPLFFWLINLSWKMLGVHEALLRLIPFLFSLGTLYFVKNISQLLWKEHPHVEEISWISVWVLATSSLWMAFTTAVMFDIFIVFFSVLSIWSLLKYLEKPAFNYWIILSIAIGLGLLAKGPTIFLQVLPIAVSLPFLHPKFREKSGFINRSLRSHFYWGVWIAFISGIVLLLLWAIPAGISGGGQYQHDIFWGQTANRIYESFAHRRPIYWYLLWVPFAFFPWVFLITVWRGIAKIPYRKDFGSKVCLMWGLSTLIVISLISGKQVHYLLPIFPSIALIFARGLIEIPFIDDRDKLWTFFLFALLGGIVTAVIIYAPHIGLIELKKLPLWLGALFVFASLRVLRVKNSFSYVKQVALLNTLGMLLFYGCFVRVTIPAYDLNPISQQLRQQEERNVPIAHQGKYHGQFDFVGRLPYSPTETEDLTAWFSGHHQGIAIIYTSGNTDFFPAVFQQDYRGKKVLLVNESQWHLINNKSYFDKR